MVLADLVKGINGRIGRRGAGDATEAAIGDLEVGVLARDESMRHFEQVHNGWKEIIVIV